MAAAAGEITDLIRAVQSGDKRAEDRLIFLIYPELRRLARLQMCRERSEHTLQPTALVHEAYIRLTLQRERTWQSRTHFLAIAAHVMRQVLIDYARARLRQKRGAGEIKTCLDEQFAAAELRPIGLVQLDDCLSRLSKVDSRQAQIVEMRFFGGLGVDEVAQELGISPKTVKRDWQVVSRDAEGQWNRAPKNGSKLRAYSTLP